MNLRVAEIEEESYTNGPGARTVLWTFGCPIRCPGCQNRHLWPFDGGIEMSIDEVAEHLLATGRPISISGGEPMLQAAALADLLVEIKVQDPDRHVIIFTGYALEDLLDLAEVDKNILWVLRYADLLVDGPYMAELDHDFLQWRGSANQRAIDLAASIEWGILPFEREPYRVREPLVLLDWDQQVLQVTEAGDVLGTAGQMDILFSDQDNGHGLVETRICGQRPSTSTPRRSTRSGRRRCSISSQSPRAAWRTRPRRP